MTGSQQYPSFVGGYYCYTLFIILLHYHAGLQRCNVYAAVHSSNVSAVTSSLNSNIKATSSALLEFKAGITSDPGSLLASWINGSNPCDQSRPWQGVACDAEGRNLAGLRLAGANLSGAMISATALATMCAGGHLSVLNLYNNSLSGSLPPSLGVCFSLRRLDLRHNLLSGPLPPSAFSNLSSLRFLGLGYNTLSGPLPPQIWHLPALRSLYVKYPAGYQNPPMQASDVPEVLPFCATLTHLSLGAVSFNNITGKHLMTSLSQCKRLQYLFLNETSLAGTIPEAFWQLPSLTTLELFSLGDQLAPASLPASMASCPSLVTLWLYIVTLAGATLPPSLGDCKNLRYLAFKHTGVQGLLPQSVWELPELVELSLVEPNLISEVSLPQYLPSCGTIQWIDVQGVKMSGPIPPSIGNCSGLQELVLYKTVGLTGPLPETLGKLANLEYLDLFGNNLAGPVPSELGNCSKLRGLDLGRNNISSGMPQSFANLHNLQVLGWSRNPLPGGVVPEFVTANLSGLVRLYLQDCDIAQFPPRLGRLSQLTLLNLGTNTLTGSIPEELGNLSQPKVLDLSRNNFSGDVARAALLNCTSLEILRLHQNSLTGPLDKMELWKMSRLMTFTAQQNQLHGKITSNLTSSSSLVLVDLAKNHLAGALPSEKVSKGLQKLRVLILSSNKFSGAIPNWIWELPNLQLLDLSDNLLVGAMPTSMAHLEYFKRNGSKPINNSMTLCDEVPLPEHKQSPHIMSYLLNTRIMLDISHNSIYGPIPSSIGELAGLTWLDLSHNKLMGSIPPSLGSIARLDGLDLSSNSLQGTIPFELGFLTFLGRLNLSNNNLVGPIPTTNGFNTRFDPSSFQGNVGLCGYPLPNLCNTTNTTRTNNTTNLDSTMSSSWFDNNFSLNGITLGYILGIFGFLGCLWLRKRATKLMRGIYLHASQQTTSSRP